MLLDGGPSWHSFFISISHVLTWYVKPYGRVRGHSESLMKGGAHNMSQSNINWKYTLQGRQQLGWSISGWKLIFGVNSSTHSTSVTKTVWSLCFISVGKLMPSVVTRHGCRELRVCQSEARKQENETNNRVKCATSRPWSGPMLYWVSSLTGTRHIWLATSSP